MLVLTKQLKDWLVNERGVQADANDESFRSAAGAALVDGVLDAKKLDELTKDPAAETGNAILTSLKGIETRLSKLETTSTDGGDNKGLRQDAPGEPTPEGDGEPSGSKASAFEIMFQPRTPDEGTPTVNVREAHKQYDGTRKSLSYPSVQKDGRPHPLAGLPVTDGGRNITLPSDLDKAISGAYVKWSLCGGDDKKMPTSLKMTQHDSELMQYALKEMDWVGVIHGEGSEQEGAVALKHPQKLTSWHQKAILDDNTSGGLEVAPIAFDDSIITTPLLNGELFPLVNTVNITRGRRIEGASIGNVTLSSGAEGTAITLFNTASFIAAFDTTIFVVNGAIEIGLDFLSDSPIDVAGMVTQQYGEVLMAWLDNQIQNGDGSTEPEGVRNASGTVSVNAANGATGPPTVSDYEALLFGIAKQYKQGYASNRLAFCGTETSYRRSRAIAVGTTDQRRVFGMTHEDYMLLGHPYKIQEDHSNRQVTFTNYARYRMYRRLGLTVKKTTEGYTLSRSNTMLITARARFGGQLEDGNACAYIADGQS